MAKKEVQINILGEVSRITPHLLRFPYERMWIDYDKDADVLFVNIGDMLASCVTITPVTGDLYPSDNNDCESQVVRGAYDPNDKLVTPEGSGPHHDIPINSELRYVVRFQNTGTDTAFNVVIKDTLDPNLLMMTILPGASSHPYKFEISENRELIWTLAHINLPDSNINEPGSHGFVSFRIQPIPSAVDATVMNTASIYFDYNPPVQTNTVTNRLVKSQQSGWKMISIAVVASDYRKKILFPTALSRAFLYDGMYEPRDILSSGLGYWLKLPGSALPVAGFPILAETIAVKQGWNMIGSISTPISASSIVSDPPGIRTSNLFGYSTSYFITGTIDPGKGYWIKVHEDGLLILAANSYGHLAAKINIVPTSELPPPPPEEVSYTVKEVPQEYILDQNYPNPFNPITKLKYQLPVDSKVTLRIYNLLGQVVTILTDEVQQAGYKHVDWTANNVASGVYFYRLEVTSINDPNRSFTQVKKMLLMK